MSINCQQINDSISITFDKTQQDVSLNVQKSLKKLSWSCQCTMNNPSDEKGISEFCLGNHQSQIETGRQTIPKIPEYIRI